jgi:hypothetical protein
VANWIDSYFDDKYTDLEEKKKEAESDFEKAQDQNYKDYYENKPEGWKPNIEVESVLNNGGAYNGGGYNSYFNNYEAPRPIVSTTVAVIDPPVAQAPAQSYIQEMNADVVFYQDVFMMYDEKMEEFEATKASGDEEFQMPPKQKSLSDEIFEQDIDDFKDELNQELELLNNEKKEEKKVKILKGVYR